MSIIYRAIVDIRFEEHVSERIVKRKKIDRIASGTGFTEVQTVERTIAYAPFAYLECGHKIKLNKKHQLSAKKIDCHKCGFGQ